MAQQLNTFMFTIISNLIDTLVRIDNLQEPYAVQFYKIVHGDIDIVGKRVLFFFFFLFFQY